MRIRLFQGHADPCRVAGIEIEAFGAHYLKCRTINRIPIIVAKASSRMSFGLMRPEIHPAQLRTPQRRAVSDTAADPSHDVLQTQGPRLPRHLTPIAKDDHGRNAGNPKPGRQRWLVLGIHLAQAG